MKPKLQKPSHHDLRASEKYFPAYLMLRKIGFSMYILFFDISCRSRAALQPQLNFF